MAYSKLKGTGVALVTPFRKDGSVDFKSLEKIVNHTIEGGVDFLVVLGTTGEAATLSKDERDAVINFIIETNKKRVKIVVGIGGNNTNEVINNIKERNFDGIDALLSVVPFYNKPSQRGIFEHFKEIATFSPVPVIMYNIPGRTGINMTAETTIKLANTVDNIVGIKEASGNFDQISKILRDRPVNFSVLSGDDGTTLPLIAMGADGVISVVANAFPKQFSQLVNDSLDNNFKSAQAMHYKMIDFINSLFAEGNPAGIKAALDILGIASNNLRLPLTPVSKVTYQKMQSTIEELNK